MHDMINHPPHYTNHPSGIEVIEIARHMDFDLGNAVKYILRAGVKGSDGEGNELGPIDSAAAAVKDLRKAVWYIQDRIRMLQTEFSGVDLDDPYGRHQKDVIVSQEDQTQREDEGEPRVMFFGVDEAEELNAASSEAAARLLFNLGLVPTWEDRPGRHRKES